MGKLNPVEVQFWLSEAKSCKDRQQRELIHRNNYPFLIQYYEGIDKVDAREISPHVATMRRSSIINEFFPNTNALISQIMYQNPDIVTEALKPEAEEAEDLMKSALTYAFTKSDALTENRVALFDMFYAGYCAVEVDHLTKLNVGMELLPSEEEMNGRAKSILEKVKGKLKKPKNEEEAETNMAKESPPEQDAYSTNEHTYVRRWDPLRIPLDWRADRIKDRRYNLKELFFSKAEFDAKYPKFAKKVMPSDDTDLKFSQHNKQEHSRKVHLYEFQVKKRNSEYWTLLISPSLLTEEIDIFKRPYITNGFNMKIGTLHKYGVLYSIALAQVNKAMNDEMNEYVRFMKNVAEKNIPKRIIDKNKVKVDAIEALNSPVINDLVPITGSTAGAISEAPATHISVENKEMLAIFQDQKNKLWSVPQTRIAGKGQEKFAFELKQQEAGFQASQIDIQEGLRSLIVSELETIKDVVATFWDFPIFLKITGGEKPNWYKPKLIPDPNNPSRQIVENPLTDLLTGDYFIKVDISSALRPNKERTIARTIEFLQLLMTEGVFTFMQMNGKMLNFDEVAKVAKNFGFSPETLFLDAPPQVPGAVPGVPGATPPAPIPGGAGAV